MALQMFPYQDALSSGNSGGKPLSLLAGKGNETLNGMLEEE